MPPVLRGLTPLAAFRPRLNGHPSQLPGSSSPGAPRNPPGLPKWLVWTPEEQNAFAGHGPPRKASELCDPPA